MPTPTPTQVNHHDVYSYIIPSKSVFALPGKTVLITGGGQGLGVTFAEAFSATGASNIVLLGRKISTLDTTKARIEALPTNKSRVYTFEADITNKKQIDDVFAEVAATIGKIDVYIANAGYMASLARLADADVKDFQTSLSINVIGQLIAAQAFLRHKADNATLVSINTGAATTYYMAPVSAYVASKAASARLMDQLAAENPDVRVFNLHPGIVKTDMAAKVDMANMADTTPELSAAFAVWLTSPEAEFLRGRFVWANWDVEELMQMDRNGAFKANEALLQFNLVGYPFNFETKAPWE